jgi:hypothetical protein
MGSLFYNIFKSDDNGNSVWVETVADLESAKSRIIELSVEAPGQYMVLSQRGRVVGSGTIVASPAAKSPREEKCGDAAQRRTDKLETLF